MKPYEKNYAPKNRQAAAGANDNLWIAEPQKWPVDKKKYDANYDNIDWSEK